MVIVSIKKEGKINKMHFISYYTPNYKEIMDNYLLPSLNGLELPYYIEKVKNLGSWKANTDFKPIFIKHCLEKLNDNVVFMDADSIINKFPTLFWLIEKDGYDLAYHLLKWNEQYPWQKNSNKREALSGTVFLHNNDKVKRLIDRWIELNKTTGWEQVALGKAIISMPELKIYELPRRYCYITSTPRGEPLNPLKKPVISHYQCGRVMKRKERRK